jgi:hypothetical protein
MELLSQTFPFNLFDPQELESVQEKELCSLEVYHSAFLHGKPASFSYSINRIENL